MMMSNTNQNLSLTGSGTLFLNYEDWKTAVVNDFKAVHQEQTCSLCDGSGENDCFHCGNCMECEDCNGEGSIWINDEGDEVAVPSIGRLAYKKHVIKSLLKLSRYTGKSYWKTCKGFLVNFERGVL
jgi:hypothetical protein